jgi:hypothetical protein
MYRRPGSDLSGTLSLQWPIAINDDNNSTYCCWGEGKSFKQIQTQGAIKASLIDTIQTKGKGKQKDPLFLRSESKERVLGEEITGVHFARESKRCSDPHTAHNSCQGQGGLPLGTAGWRKNWGGNSPDPDGSSSSSEDERNPYVPDRKGTRSSSKELTKTKGTNRSYKNRGSKHSREKILHEHANQSQQMQGSPLQPPILGGS